MSLNPLLMSQCVTKRHKSKTILDNISFSVYSGDIIGLLGPNGAGKSTLLKILCGLIFPDDGEVMINTTMLSHDSLDGLLPKIGAVIGNPNFKKHSSILEILEQHLEFMGADTVATEVLETVGLLTSTESRFTELSTGQKMRFNLALATAHNPQILLLDEPLNGLDPEGIEMLINLLRERQNQGIGIILSGHTLKQLESLATRFMILSDGVLRAQADSQDISDVTEYYNKIVS